MSQTSGFFESVVDETGTYDRIYYASQFARYFSLFIGNGVFAEPTDQLKVGALGTGELAVLVKDGTAFINGYWFIVDSNEEVKLESSSTTYARYDAIVARCNMSDRTIQLAVKKGTFAESNPQKPTITQNDEVYELCLAYVYIDKDATEIFAENIEDTRPDNAICGFVSSLVKQLTTSELFAQYTAIFNKWFFETKAEVRDIVNAISSDPEGTLAGFNLLFDAWFDTIKDKIGEEPATNLQNQINDVEKKAKLYYNGFVAKETIFNDDGSITENSEDGDTKTTVFNDDGSITETLVTVDKLRFVKTVTFNEDISISEEVVE